MKVAITGATGNAGSAVLREALLDDAIEKVTVISRRPLDATHAKLEVVVHEEEEAPTP